ncbi:tetratricopeptide repeat protein [Candidatus Poribacteria bacterium]|nr:tetratricopeptide repeat protein [Candidatus Poribacteria bacterium]
MLDKRMAQDYNLNNIHRKLFIFYKSIFIAILLLLLLFPHGYAQESSTTPPTDYFNHITLFSDGRITRFTHTPISVYISPVIKESPYHPNIVYAMKKWEQVAKGKIKFQMTDTSTDADIRISWGYANLMDIHDTRLGSAVLRRLTNTTVQTTDVDYRDEGTTPIHRKEISVEVILILEGEENNKELSQAEMRTVCLHEIGHALGLWGHSPHPGDICYPTASAQTPSQRDINTLLRLYNTPINTPQHDIAIKELKTEILVEPREHYPRFLLATVYYDKGDMESAIHHLKECMKLNQSFKPAIEKLLQAYKNTGQLDTAIDLLEKRIREKPNAADYNTLGIYYYKQGQFNTAINAFENAVKHDPYLKAAKHNLHQLFREKAFTAMKAKNYSEATQALERVIQLNPLDSKSYTLIADGYAQVDDYVSAIKYYEKALELNRVSQLTKRGLARCYNNYGVMLRNSQKWDEAITIYRKALDLHPKLHIARVNLIDAFWQKANTLRNAGKVAKAIDTYLELQKLSPEDTRISSLLGELYLKNSNFSDAVSAFHKVYTVEPDTPQARHNLIAAYHQSAHNLMDQRNYKSAINLLQKAVVVAPDEPNIRVSLAHAFQNIGDYDSAQAQLSQVLKDKPNNKQASTEQINLYIRHGNTLVKQKKYTAALAQFTSIPEEQRDTVIHNIIGYLYLVQRKYSEALTAFEKVIVLDPHNFSTYQNLKSLESQISSRLFEKEKAEKLIRTRCALAICLMNQQQFDSALTKYKEAMDRNSEIHRQLLINTGIKLARGFEAQNDNVRKGEIQSLLNQLNPEVDRTINDR